MAGLYEKLTAYAETDMCPFHMPGHKRNGEKFSFKNPFSFDVTEIDGFDNLHHAEGILKDAMDRAAGIYGAEKMYFLVNGSSCGILAAVSSCVKPGGKILVARNCHKSVYHALILQGLCPVYLSPKAVSGWGMNGGISPEEVEKKLKENPDTEAVLLTSPTYEGICSDVEGIAVLAHDQGIPLIVDSAHGAHFSFRVGKKMFPPPALSLGADLVIESLHKTLPSLTQTAVIHKKSDLIDEKRLEWYLQVFQSSSPSYVLMASIDSCISYMAGEQGKADMKVYEKQLEEIREKIGKLTHIRILTDREVKKENGVYYDNSKLVLKSTGMGGHEFYDTLRLEYHIQPEMCTETYVILMTSPADTREVFHKLGQALVDIDKENEGFSGKVSKVVAVPEPEVVFSPAEAVKKKRRNAELWESEGKISAEFAYIYPPGIPVLAPGEKITGPVLRVLRCYQENSLEIQGMEDRTGQTIQVLEESRADYRKK